MISEESFKGVTRPIAKVRITWTEPFIDNTIDATTNEANRGALLGQVSDLITENNTKWAHLNSGKVVLDGTWYPMPDSGEIGSPRQVGWWTNTAPGALGGAWPKLTIEFSPKPVLGFTVAGDTALQECPKHFKVTAFSGATVLGEKEHINNNQIVVSDVFDSVLLDVDKMELEVYETSDGNCVKVSEFSTAIVETYDGDDIFNLSILEETEGAQGIIPIGQISCNDMDLTLQNANKRYMPFNSNSDLFRLVRAGRKIEPFVGFNINGVDHYTPKGVYWSSDWQTSAQDMQASTSARDRMELLRNLTYGGTSPDDNDPAEKTYWLNQSVKYVMSQIFDLVKIELPDFFWDIDDSLDSIIIPIAFFKRKSYFDVLKDLVGAGKAFAYFDTPTEAEREASPIMRDILRIKSAESLFPDPGVIDTATAYTITDDDYFTIKQESKIETVINSVNVTRHTFAIDPEQGIPVENRDARFAYTIQDKDSIRENGLLEYNYPTNELIQTEALAVSIGTAVINTYNEPNKEVTVNLWGDPTLRIGDTFIAPQYKDDLIESLGYFATKKIRTEYDGSLSMEYEGFKLKDIS